MQRLTDKEFLTITLPFMLSTMTQPLMGAVNTAVMGQLPQPKYIAAVSLGVTLFNTIYWLFTFLRVSTTGYAAQAYGAADKELGLAAFFQPCCIALAAGCGCLLLQQPILEAYLLFIKPEAEVAQLCREYYGILVWGAPLVLFNYVGLGWLMGQARVKAAVGLQMSMNLLNCGLSIYLVSYQGLAVAGVAWATLLCQLYGGLAAALLLHLYGGFDYGRLPWRKLLDWRDLASLLAVNANLMIRTVCLMGVNNIVAAVGAGFGTTVLAANAVLLQIKDVISYLIDGMANGASIFAGKAMGQKNRQLFEDNIRITYRWLAVFSLLLTLVYQLGHSFFIRIFTVAPEVIALAEDYSFYVTLYPLVSGVGMVLYGVFCGATSMAPIRNNMLLSFACFYLLERLAVPLGANHGLWLAWLCFYLAQSVILRLYLPVLRRPSLWQD